MLLLHQPHMTFLVALLNCQESWKCSWKTANSGLNSQTMQWHFFLTYMPQLTYNKYLNDKWLIDYALHLTHWIMWLGPDFDLWLNNNVLWMLLIKVLWITSFLNKMLTISQLVNLWIWCRHFCFHIVFASELSIEATIWILTRTSLNWIWTFFMS